MNKVNPTEKSEIIEQALQESIGGGVYNDNDVCAVTCSIFSIDVCRIDLCSTRSQ